MNFANLPVADRREIIRLVQAENGLHRQIIEKDWWVTAVLRALFALPYAEHLSFKGGTSLSKCWNLIQRMSEDVDIAVEREFLGFTGSLSKTQISDKLRRAACGFVRDKLQYDLAQQLIKNGIRAENFSVAVNITPVTTTDPEIIEVSYQPAFADNAYIRPKVLLEVGGRSMNEPVKSTMLQSFIDETMASAPFVEQPFEVRAVVPERTFLEKLFLLHEEFSKPQELMRSERMSRHLYDIAQMMYLPVSESALNDSSLYCSVMEHRKTFIGLKNFDYASLQPKSLRVVPPDSIVELWRKDYEIMQETMIYGPSDSFDVLLKSLRVLNERINRM